MRKSDQRELELLDGVIFVRGNGSREDRRFRHLLPRGQQAGKESRPRIGTTPPFLARLHTCICMS